MRIFAFSVILLVVAFCSGCATHGDSFQSSEQVLYYDRNSDGKVDQERHHYPGVSDADWELRDDNYDGRYEKKIVYGYAVTESAVDLPVPTHAHIEPQP
jgi:hypothetical protein